MQPDCISRLAWVMQQLDFEPEHSSIAAVAEATAWLIENGQLSLAKDN